MERAFELISGQWLGGFDQYTLMKGPGYPAFVALAAASGLPLTLWHGLFQFLAIAISGWAVGRVTGRPFAGWAAFVLLVFLPAAFDHSLQRVFRDQIYWAQSILVFALLTVVVFAPPVRRSACLLLGVGTGLVLGWTWLTREEGAWFMPGLAVLALAGLVHHWLNGPSLRRIFCALADVVAGFALVNLAFMTVNLFIYGAFVGVDFNERNFNAALSALQSIDDGKRIDHVPASASVRQLAARYSPTFAPLAESLQPGGSLDVWTEPGCQFYPQSCGEIAGGWFVWAFRDAAEANGFYASPAIASKKFGQIAEEIDSACASGALTCRTSIFSFVPPMTAQQWLLAAQRALAALRMTSLIDAQHVLEPEPRPAEEADDLARYWMFLNYPKIVGPKVSNFKIGGWFYDRSSTSRPDIRFTESGQPAGVLEMKIVGSRDIAQSLGDPAASNNRFSATLHCPTRCMLEAVFADGTSTQVPLEANKGTTSLQKTIWIDTVEGLPHPAAVPDKRVDFARSLINAEVSLYSWLFPPLLAVGFCCLVFAGLRDAFRRRIDPAFVAGLCAFILVGTRLAVLGIADATSFPAIVMFYSIPAVYLAAIGSVLSIAAVFPPLSSDRRETAPPTAELRV